MSDPFSLFLFSVEPEQIRRATAAGVRGVIVDCEYRGKVARQTGFDTQINRHTMEDLDRVRRCTEGTVICRINGFGETTFREVEEAIRYGADEILLPMVRTQAEVEAVLDQVDGRCGVGVMVECMDAVTMIEEIASLPLARVYVGLNDLSIDRGSPNIFTALVDGTLDAIRRACPVPLGFAALTLPEKGFPIPCRLIMAELMRQRSAFSILRRAFLADVGDREMTVEVPRIYAALEAMRERDEEEVRIDRAMLRDAIAAWPKPLVPTGESAKRHAA